MFVVVVLFVCCCCCSLLSFRVVVFSLFLFVCVCLRFCCVYLIFLLLLFLYLFDGGGGGFYTNPINNFYFLILEHFRGRNGNYNIENSFSVGIGRDVNINGACRHVTKIENSQNSNPNELLFFSD